MVMDPAAYASIARLTENDGASLPRKTRDLVLETLELAEDAWLEQVVERRPGDKRPSVPLRALKRRLKMR